MRPVHPISPSRDAPCLCRFGCVFIFKGYDITGLGYANTCQTYWYRLHIVGWAKANPVIPVDQRWPMPLTGITKVLSMKSHLTRQETHGCIVHTVLGNMASCDARYNAIVFKRYSQQIAHIHPCEPGPLFTKRTDALPQDLVTSRSREIRV